MTANRLRWPEAVVLVTGASGGIGAATARLLAQRGARALLLTGRDERTLEQVARETGGTAIVADLASTDGPAGVAREALRLEGRVDVLVNNAGVGWAGPTSRMDPADLRRLVAVNLVAPLELTGLLLPGMVDRGRGRIVHVSSIAGCLGVAQEAVYSATKAGLNAHAESLRAELAPAGVHVGVVVPGAVDTAFFVRRGSRYDRRLPRQQPAGRVAEAVVRAAERGSPRVFVPRWLSVPVWLQGAAPPAYRSLLSRLG